MTPRSCVTRSGPSGASSSPGVGWPTANRGAPLQVRGCQPRGCPSWSRFSNEEFGIRLEGSSHRVVRHEAIEDDWGGLYADIEFGNAPSRFIANRFHSPDSEYEILGTQASCASIWRRNEFSFTFPECFQ